MHKKKWLKRDRPRTERGSQNRNRIRIGIDLIKVSMIYCLAYLVMVLVISAGWIVLAVLKKPEFIEKPLEELKNKIRPLLSSKKIN